MDRFWNKVEKYDDGCWVWTAATNERGYGVVKIDGKVRKAHRISYEMRHGQIPKGLQIDHLCRNRSCVRPDHLEAVTQQENIRRGEAGALNNYNARKTHCPKGHAYTGENVQRNGSGRRCRTCRVEINRRYRETRR